MHVIRDRGGAHRSELCRLTGHGWGNIGYHLHVLEKDGAIIREVHANRSWAFKPELTPRQRQVLATSYHGHRRRMIKHLRLGGSRTLTDLEDELGTAKNLLRYHMEHLVQAGIVRRSGSNPHSYHAPDDQEEANRRQRR